MDLENAKEIIRMSIDENMSKDNYVWRSKAFASLEGVRTVIGGIRKYIKGKEYMHSIKLVAAALQELRVVDIDDSNDGCCGKIYFELIDELDLAASLLETKYHDEAFNLLFDFVNRRFHNCLADHKEDLLEIMRSLCGKNKAHLKIVEKKLAAIKKKREELYKEFDDIVKGIDFLPVTK